MKEIFLTMIIILLTAGCRSSGEEFVDTGLPGQIKVIVFRDANGNGKLDNGETGLTEEVGLSQDVSCPAQSLVDTTMKRADSSGAVVLDDLKPGKYCISYHGERLPTSKLAFEVYLSSEQDLQAYIGLADN